jgi:hypothetical protein
MTRISIESDHKATVTSLVKSSLAMQCKMLQSGLKRTQARIKAFEKEFGQTSETFYQAYQAGQMGDDEKVMEWAGEWETYQELKKALDLLKGAKVC